MSFTGTQHKCKVCEKTVYPVEQLSADGIAYHKSCFKCSHCKGMLELGNYSSMEGVLYCKPHFEQLFKETAAKFAENLTPDLTRSPSKAASIFSGTQEKCATCAKTAHPLEKTLDGVGDSAGEDNRNHNLHQEILMRTEETVTLEENIEDLHSLHREMKALFDAPAAPKEVLFSTLAAGKNRTEVVQKLCQITDLVSDGVLRIKQLPEDIRSYRKKDIVLDIRITKGDKF